ncbi:MAG: hypothetical protein IIY58_01550 [Aeriscardovia sp.]|nr:hypothetical protein [Aeriscardovia sp.]
MGVRWPYKWGKRFNDNLSPKEGYRGFDDIPNGVSADYNAKMEERWGCLASRIARHGGLTTSSFIPSSGSTYHPTLSPITLAWNKNPQCPPKTWDNLQAPTDGRYDLDLKSTGYKCCIWRSENKIGQERFNNPKNCKWNSKCSSKPQGWEYSRHKKCLAIAHHNSYLDTLKTADYTKAYFNSVFSTPSTVCQFIINADSGKQHGFWLINEDDSPFVYAILKSSMFRAWCELTAYTDGEGHFTVGMWDTFPLPALTNSQRSTVIIAGQELRKGWRWGQTKLDKLVDGLFAPTCSTHVLSDRCRKRILAEGFLDAFYGA